MKSSQDLVMAIVAPIGTDIDTFVTNLSTCLRTYNRKVHLINLTDLIEEFLNKQHRTKIQKLQNKIEVGNRARSSTKMMDLFSRFAISKISEIKAKSGADDRNVYIIRQLKRPEELNLLKSLYSQNFFLLGITSSQEERLQFLTKDLFQDEISTCSEDALKLFKVDDDEQSDTQAGQKVIKIFSKSDIFFNQNAGQDEIYRLLDLLHCSPFVSPKRDEILMNLAFAASTKSIDLSRQVGAVLANDCGDVISTGANDVPKFGGGQYSDEDEYKVPDWIRGEDPNKAKISSIIENILKEFTSEMPRAEGQSEKEAIVIEKIKEILGDSSISDLTEFTRAVHAEMEAILSCARQGKSTRNTVLYCTTFPCHNCAKHIVGAGIKKVLFIEPYPKSLALELHGDSISEFRDDHVRFTQFTGIGPSRFNDLFSLTFTSGKKVNRKGDDGQIVKFVRHSADSKFTYTENQLKHIGVIELDIVSKLSEIFSEDVKKVLRDAS